MNAINETDVLARLRKELSAQGYTVEVRPRMAVDEAGVSLAPDLLARKGGETVLVGVKGLRSGPEDSTRLARLAEVARDHEGWSFRLVLAEARDQAPHALPLAVDLRDRLADARRLFRKGDAAPAYLFLWSVFTAAASRRLLAFGIAQAHRDEPSALVRSLIAHGLAAQEDLAWLAPAADLQTDLAAGHVDLEIPRELFDRLSAHANALTQGRQGELGGHSGPQGLGLDAGGR